MSVALAMPSSTLGTFIQERDDQLTVTVPTGHYSGLVDFQAVLEWWERETVFLSDPNLIVGHPGFRWMVDNVEQITPFIIDELRKQPSHLVWVLDQGLAEQRPYDQKGSMNIRAMTKAWVLWGDSVGRVL